MQHCYGLHYHGVKLCFFICQFQTCKSCSFIGQITTNTPKHQTLFIFVTASTLNVYIPLPQDYMVKYVLLSKSIQTSTDTPTEAGITPLPLVIGNLYSYVTVMIMHRKIVLFLCPTVAIFSHYDNRIIQILDFVVVDFIAV